MWIIKPGESTNRGRGIFVSSNLKEIKINVSANIDEYGQERSYII